ncbi:MAG: hypothetical protein FD165_1110 [Gammaproteobacteria bacterium]|nr:MAG: hypothetical protein FD165_1110 [Gammaproteobacteria bacterium]TND07269.1 MAG: hypothetical protein FD120_7 [Gammaproteobacteria bacterium]
MKNLLEQLEKERRKVDFDSFDISVKEIVSMSHEGIIDIAPEYQRQFRWPEKNQSKFIESVFLGIPIPSLFMAANRDGTWELIDGVQRLSSLIHYIADAEQLSKFGIKENLKLKGLDILSEFNGKTFDDIPQSLRLKFTLRPLKITTLSDKSDLKVRFDLFERLNTGGVKLTDQEIRACVYRGEFNDFISKLSKNGDFASAINLPRSNESDGTREELVLKFFAYFYDRDNFVHSVVGFLNDYMQKASLEFDYASSRDLFERTFNELKQELPNGIRRGNRNVTPINLYEAVAIGAADIIAKGGTIIGKNAEKWINDEELKKLTSGATNSRKRLKERIDYCSERFSQ